MERWEEEFDDLFPESSEDSLGNHDSLYGIALLIDSPTRYRGKNYLRNTISQVPNTGFDAPEKVIARFIENAVQKASLIPFFDQDGKNRFYDPLPEYLNTHEAVEYALKAGKTVDPTILYRYPDLIATYGV